MSLLSADISKVRKLSLTTGGLRTAAKPTRVKPAPTAAIRPTAKPPTLEEVVYSQLVAECPLVEDMVEILDLVSPTTGERIRKVEATHLDKDRLRELAEKVLEPSNSYTLQEVVDRIAERTQVDPQRAYTGFIYMVQAEAILSTPARTYYLHGSTPF